VNVTQADLIAVLQEEAYRRSSVLALSGTPQQQVAMEIGKAVKYAFDLLLRGGYLPLGMPPPRDIVVDYDRMRTAPQYVVTVRF
jgi:hypothetical protein